MAEEVRVRYAPSPTGNPHVGNMRTALFTYLFAKHNRGKFLLRIEDTDKKREVEESYSAIYDSLKWLGLSWDEKVILQSERLDIYKEHALQLLNSDKAYQQEEAIFFKTKKEGSTSWIDLVGNKSIKFENRQVEDFVILKSDEYPTYHLASVVDDHLMNISHVTRGEDWISSTPKHIMLYESFGWDIPQFAHSPNILATDRSKLSKRHGSIGVLDYKRDGFLPEALINFLVLLGWTPPSGKEILTLSEMIEEFDLKDLNTAPAIFDVRKLEWMNGEYIRKTQNSKLKTQILEYLKDISQGKLEHPADEELDKVIPLVKERIKKLSDFIPLTDFLWEKPEYEQEVFEKVVKKRLDIVKLLKEMLEVMEKMEKPWKADMFEKTFRQFGESHGLSATQTFQLIRVAISGQLVSPPLFESVKILGEEETLKRANEALAYLEKSSS
ncbi:glutamate--tRNA ligase [Candidatus Microgenomates bacterium]|nr:glutamate--tRNA ligase [Candidatus Microgenomates bacterium]